MYRFVCPLYLVLTLFATPVHGQTGANGGVRGVVKDQQGAVLPGVLVSATSVTVPGVHTATTDQAGRYRLDLPPGDYTLVGELTGFAKITRTPVTIRAGLNVSVDMAMTVGGIDEVIEVRQDTPLLEVVNSAQAVNVSGELLRSIPLSERREWFGALMLAPGVTSSEWVNNSRLLFVHGADPSTNIVQIDGVDVTPAQVASVDYLSLNNDAIDDVQIKTAGLDASSPLGLGGIINIATSSGTNALRGAATVSYQPRNWNGSNTPGGTSSTVTQTQVDLSAGGPLVENRVWVFGAYRYANIETGASRTPDQLEALAALVPGFTAFDSTNRAHFWFTKITAQPSDAHQLSGFYQRDVNPFSQVEAVTAHPRFEARGGSSASVRMASVWSNRLTTRFSAGYNDKRRDVFEPETTGPLERIYSSTIRSGTRLIGNGRLVDRGAPTSAWAERPDSKLTLSLDASLFADTASGSHDVQAGVYAVPHIRIRNRTLYVNGGFTFEEAVLREPGVLTSGTVPFHRMIFEGSSLDVIHQEGHDYAAYVQDSWRPSPRLTISAGVRIDHIVWTDLLFDVQSQRSTEVGPRFGVVFTPSGDGRDAVRAHWVRVHDQPSQMAMSVGTAALGRRDLYDLDLDGTFDTTRITPPTFAVTPGRRIDPDLHQPFVHEWGIGYSRQLPGTVTVGANYLRRRYADRPALVETNAKYEGRQFVGYADEAFNELYEVTNNVWNSPLYRSLEVSFTKRTTRIHALASYVRQWRHMDGTWQPNDPAAFIQPEAFANNRGIGSPSGNTGDPSDANSLSGYNMTQRRTASGQWQDHAIRLGVTYQAPWSLLIASNYTFQSGVWSGPVITRVAEPDPAFGPSTVTLSNGRVVDNPLATVLRFAHPTRGAGQLRTPPLHVWNLRIGRRFTWGRGVVDAAIDCFNLTNNGSDFSFESGANQTFNPRYGTTTFRQLPRSAQAMLRISF